MSLAEHTRIRVSTGETFAGETDLEVMCCPTCSILYAVPHRLLERARKDHETGWYCPNGHSLYFPGRTPEKQIEQLKDTLARERSRSDQLAASNTALRGAATRARNERDRLKQRATAGVCPHPDCHRHFANLERHVAAKHPELLEEVRGT